MPKLHDFLQRTYLTNAAISNNAVRYILYWVKVTLVATIACKEESTIA